MPSCTPIGIVTEIEDIHSAARLPGWLRALGAQVVFNFVVVASHCEKLRLATLDRLVKMPPKKRLILPPDEEVPKAPEEVPKAKPKKLVLPKDHVLGIESTEEPIVPVTTKQVRLTRFTHDGKYYYRNCENDSLYQFLGSHKRGCYMGRWDSVQERIVRDAPESDSEL